MIYNSHQYIQNILILIIFINLYRMYIDVIIISIQDFLSYHIYILSNYLYNLMIYSLFILDLLHIQKLINILLIYRILMLIILLLLFQFNNLIYHINLFFNLRSQDDE